MTKIQFEKIAIRSDDLTCAKEMAEDLGMELVDFISLLVSDAAKTILTPNLPSLCQFIVSKRLSMHHLSNEAIYLDKPKGSTR